MKAIVWTRYGPPDVLQLRDIEKPTPKDNEVLIKIHAATVFPGDCELRSFKIRIWLLWLVLRLLIGLRKPRGTRILGQELAGEVESVGKEVTLFEKGDQVFGATEMGFGAYAEYICLPADGALVIKPTNMSYEEAAAVPIGGINALHFLRRANIQSGEKVLINGAAGSIGTLAVQIAKLFGAEVTAVDSVAKLDMVRTIGADHVIDYTKEDFTNNGKTYDVIFDVVGKSSYSRSLRSLNRNGRYLLANTPLPQMLRGLWTSRTSDKKVISQLARPRREDLIFLKELIEAGKLVSVIDRRYPMTQTAEAHRYVETGQKIGHVVITVEHSNKT